MISTRLPAPQEAALKRPADQREAEIDAHYIGQGGGLRDSRTVADPRKRAIVERLREKHADSAKE